MSSAFCKLNANLLTRLQAMPLDNSFSADISVLAVMSRRTNYILLYATCTGESISDMCRWTGAAEATCSVGAGC